MGLLLPRSCCQSCEALWNRDSRCSSCRPLSLSLADGGMEQSQNLQCGVRSADKWHGARDAMRERECWHAPKCRAAYAICILCILLYA